MFTASAIPVLAALFPRNTVASDSNPIRLFQATIALRFHRFRAIFCRMPKPRKAQSRYRIHGRNNSTMRFRRRCRRARSDALRCGKSSRKSPASIPLPRSSRPILPVFPAPTLTPPRMMELVHCVRQRLLDRRVDGVVVTHGTDTLEETAYLHDLALNSEKTGDFVGAVRNSSNSVGAARQISGPPSASRPIRLRGIWVSSS